MAALPETPLRFGLVGTGPEMVEAIEALRSVPGVEIAVVADASDRSEGARLAQRLNFPLEKNWMGVFRTDANIVLELNGDDRQYERLLSIKPPGVEVMSVLGTRLLLQLLRLVAGPAPGAPAAEPAAPETPARGEPLLAALRAALAHGGKPEEAVMTLLPAVVAAGGMDFAAVALPEGAGFAWMGLPGSRESLAKIPPGLLLDAMGHTEPAWLARPVHGIGVAGLLPLWIGTEPLGLLVVGRSGALAATPAEQAALRFGADLLASVLRATQPAPAGNDGVREVVKEVVKEVPVEVVKELPVVKEVVREVRVEIPVETVREGPGADEEELRRLRRQVEELQAAQERLTAMSDQIPMDEKMQALVNMASGVAHVFNNVLAGILGRTQLLLQKARRGRAPDLATGLGEIEHAARAGITALARIQAFSARPVEAFRPVDLNDVVQQAVEQTRHKWRDEPAAKGARVELITRFGASEPISGIEGDLREAVVQLIANAVDALAGDGTITVRTGSEPGRGLIAVSDTGGGMSAAVRRRALEPFFSTKGERGLGLGLAVVYGVTARHGGQVAIESEPGQGTTVTLSLPTAGVPAEAALPEEERAEVLVVDDDEGVRTALVDILRSAGYAVTVAASGLEGMAKARERESPFDLLITDLAMPDVSGWEVVEAVRRRHAATPVVIMSGFDRARATRRAKELGIDLVLAKPFDIQEFLNTVRGLLAGRKRQ